MIITKNSGKEFAPCPEYTGRAVCVDVTPMREQDSKFGKRNVFKLVFEVDEVMDDEAGRRFCVWSQNFTPSLNDKSNFRKFLRTWFGRDMTAAELEAFDTEALIGRPAFLVVSHETSKEGQVYANIALCQPHKAQHGQALLASGDYIRKQDREAAQQSTAMQQGQQPKKEPVTTTAEANPWG